MSDTKQQENNPDIQPSTSRQEVEVDKIFELLQNAKNEIENKQEIKRRIDKIIEEIPKNSSSNQKKPSKKESQLNDEQQEPLSTETTLSNPIVSTPKKISTSYILNYIFILIITVLTFFLFEKQIKDKASTAYTEAVSFTHNSIDYINNIWHIIRNNDIQSNQYKEKNASLQQEIKKLKSQNSFFQQEVKSLNLQNEAQIVILNEQITQLENTITTLSETNKKLKEKPIKKHSTNSRYQSIINNEQFPAIKQTEKLHSTIKCYDSKPSQFYLTPTCKTKIKTFLKKNPSISKFEIIGVIDTVDFPLNYEIDLDPSLKKYYTMGLGRYRVLEASWFLMENKKSIKLIPPNYIITSKKNNRGIIIRTYK